MRLACGLVVATLSLAAPAYADDATEARRLYRKAEAHFALGEFTDAAQAYEAAFRLKQDPALLYNAAQSWRLGQNEEKALVEYRNYLELFPHARNAATVRKQVRELEAAIAARDKATSSPPKGTIQPKMSPETAQPPSPGIVPPPEKPAAPRPALVPAPTTTPPPAAAPSRSAELTAQPATQPSDRPTPLYKKWWLWTAIGVVVAGGVVAGVVLATSGSSPPHSHFGSTKVF